jgi:molybdate transport repressor ModE-like protein/molybdopterin-binding protein
VTRATRVSSTDVALLKALARQRSVVAASRAIGISRDRAVYRLQRLAQAFGGPVVRGARGGRHHGRTVLTGLGDRIARGGFDSVELLNARPATPLDPPNVLRGTYRAGPTPWVAVRAGLRLRVAFPADDGEAVALWLDPDAILVARRRFPSSARNVLPGRIERLYPDPGLGRRTIAVRVGRTRLRAAVTAEAVRALALAVGGDVVLYVKATALRRTAP